MGRISGYLPPEGFAAKMSRMLMVYRDLPALKAKLEADPDDLETASLLISVYAAGGDTNHCRKIVGKMEEKDPDNAQGRLVPAYNALAEAYIAKEKGRNALKYYRKVLELVKTPTEVADARLGLAYAHYVDSMKFDSGSKPAANRLKKAQAELDDLTKLPDLPDDRREQVRQLLATVTGSAPQQ